MFRFLGKLPTCTNAKCKFWAEDVNEVFAKIGRFVDLVLLLGLMSHLK